MALQSDDYVPDSEDELYEQESDDLQDISNGEGEDFEGSAIQSLLRTNARLIAQNHEQHLDQLYDAGYLETAQGTDLDRKVRELGIQRKPSIPATGVARFLRNSEPDANYTIKKNLSLTTENGEVDFLTTEKGSVQFISGFESSSLDTAWSGDTSSFGTQQSTIDDGSYSLDIPATSGKQIHRTDVDIREGDRLRFSIYLPSNGIVGLWFGVTDASNYHAIVVDSSSDVLKLVESDSGTESQLDSTSVSVPNGSWLTVEVDWSITDEVDGVLYDSNDDALANVDGTASVDGGGVGVESRDGNTAKYGDTLCTTATTLNVKGAVGGEQTNVGSDRITVMSSQPSGIDEVSNPLPTGDDSYTDTNGETFVVGQNEETDNELRKRALDSTARGGAATADAVSTALRAIDEVRGVTAFENETTSQDSDGRPAMSVEFVIDGGTNENIANAIHDNVGFTERLTGGHVGTKVTYTIQDDFLSEDETYEWSEPTEDTLEITADLVIDGTYEGDDSMRSIIVDYIGGTDVDGSTAVGVSVGENVRVDAIRDRLVGSDTGVLGIASITIDSDSDGTDDTTTDSNGLTVYDVAKSDIAIVDASSITVNTTQA